MRTKLGTVLYSLNFFEFCELKKILKNSQFFTNFTTQTYEFSCDWIILQGYCKLLREGHNNLRWPKSCPTLPSNLHWNEPCPTISSLLQEQPVAHGMIANGYYLKIRRYKYSAYFVKCKE